LRSKEIGKGFTLIELLITIAVFVIIIVIVVIKFNPTRILQKSRDTQRLADVTTLATAINLYLASGLDFKNLAGPYASIDAGFSDDSARKKNDGTGWVPINLTAASGGASLAALPLDPLNTAVYYYRVGISAANKAYEVDTVFEGQENLPKMAADGGNDPNVYEVGTDLTIL